MGSFSKLSVFPVGYFRAACVWLLRNQKSVASRVITISAEIERIGFVNVLYEDTADGKKSENRLGVLVTPNSTLEKLLQAYIIQGGNPLDISSFMHPDYIQITGYTDTGQPITKERYPYGGVLAPKSVTNPIAEPDNKTGYNGDSGGYILSSRYYPARQGGRVRPSTLGIARAMHEIRSWANQDIKERLLELEARIIKQCDLREQLVYERDVVLKQAFGDALDIVGGFNPDIFDGRLRLHCLMSDLAATINRASLGQVVSWGAADTVPFLDFTFPNVDSEYRDPLGG